jgi:uncharacterized repeat protein (TIGR01451 family)
MPVYLRMTLLLIAYFNASTVRNIAGAQTTVPVSDEFTGMSLNTSLWTFVNPVGDGSFKMTGTNILLQVPAGKSHDLWTGGENAVRIVQPVSNSDFDVRAKFDSAVTQQYQAEGILVEQDGLNYLRFDLLSDGTTPRMFSGSISSGNASTRINQAITASSPIWLRVMRSGNTFTFSYSKDGISFTAAGTYSQVLTVNRVGLYGDNGVPSPALTASVDYFRSGTQLGPDFTVTESDSGNFTEGGVGSFTVTVANTGSGPTSGTVTLTDNVPPGLTPTAASGTGWTCQIAGATVTCTRSDALAASSSFPAITISVNISTLAPGSLTNTVTASGGGELDTLDDDSASDQVAIKAAGPDLTIAKTHTNNFTQGGTGSYTITVSNAGSILTSGAVTVRDSVPAGLTPTTASGTGWTCSIVATTVSCSRSDALAAGAAYPAIGVAVNVAPNAPPSVVNSASVSGGGESNTANDVANDTTTIIPLTGAGPVSDSFDASSLNTSIWKFVDPKGNSALTFNETSAQITVPSKSNHDSLANNAARIVQTISNVNFEVVVKFNSALMFGEQSEGILVEQDPTHFLVFRLLSDGTSTRLAGTAVMAGVRTQFFNAAIAVQAPLWLKLARAGNTWTTSWSGDGLNYTSAGSVSQALVAADIGPFAANFASTEANAPAMTATVDYFFNSAAPVANDPEPPPFTRVVIDPKPGVTLVERALADIDGDGRQDAIVGLLNPSQGLYWYAYPHSGLATDPWTRHTIAASGQFYEDLAPYDVNQDGAVDVIASVNQQFVWFENPRGHGGNPAVDPWPQHVIGNTPEGENNVLLQDIDGDGRIDVVTANSIYFQITPTQWLAVQYNAASRGVALLDIGSGNGAVNLVTTGPAPYNMVWYENPREHGGNARKDKWIMHTIGPAYPCTLGGNCDDPYVAGYGAADLNGDGRMDVVSIQSEALPNVPPPPGGLIWWEAPPDRRNGQWIKHVIDATFRSAHNVRIADMDRNGTLDLVLAEQEQEPQRRVSIFFNDGIGNFRQQILSNTSGHNLWVSDAQGDGALDILSSPHGFFGAPNPLELYLNPR